MYEDERKGMIRRLKASGYVTDPRVLEAMEKVPRDEFVPDNMKEYAYQDTPLYIGEGQTISAPHMVGMMLEALDVRPGMKALDIGTGSGYHAALLAELVRPGGKVYSVEIIKELAYRAKDTLIRLGYSDTVEVIVADGSKGLPEHAPYDRITVAAAAPYVPEPLKEQLGDGGRLLVPVGGRAYQDLELIVRKGDEFEETPLGEVVFVPLVGKYGQKG